MGDSGTGKTYSIRTLVQAGVTPFIIFTEPGMETLGDLPDGSWHYKYIKPATQGWAAILDMAKKVNQLTFDNLTKVTDPNKTKFEGLMQVITSCNAFTCDCHGKQWGDVSTWGTDRALVIDSLSGISDMAMAHTVGGKPVRSPADWGIAQNMIRMILLPLTTGTTCTFVLIGHLAREYNEVTGGSTVTVSTLGQKLAPDIPLNFSDVINTGFHLGHCLGSDGGQDPQLAYRQQATPVFRAAPLGVAAEGWSDRSDCLVSIHSTHSGNHSYVHLQSRTVPQHHPYRSR